MGVRGGHDGERVVVAGLDGSDASWRAVAYAVGLARRQGALLVVAYVLPVHTVAMLAGVAWMLTETDQAACELLRRRFAAGLACTDEAWALRWEFEVVPAGDPVSGLAKVADGRRADTVVVGASRSVSHRVFPSTGVRLLRLRRWPVAVVP